jgi:CRP-like cAMP-binding protein
MKNESFNLDDKFVVDSLKSVIYLQGDIIYKARTESDCMYFIASGTVALITFAGKEVSH